LNAYENKPDVTGNFNYSYGEGVTIAQVLLLCVVRLAKFIQSMADKNAVSAKVSNKLPANSSIRRLLADGFRVTGVSGGTGVETKHCHH
jgi:hypothetical protein